MAFYFEANDGRSGEGETTFAAMKAAVGPEEAHSLADDMDSPQWRPCEFDDEFRREADGIRKSDGETFGWFAELR